MRVGHAPCDIGTARVDLRRQTGRPGHAPVVAGGPRVVADNGAVATRSDELAVRYEVTALIAAIRNRPSGSDQGRGVVTGTGPGPTAVSRMSRRPGV